MAGEVSGRIARSGPLLTGGAPIVAGQSASTAAPDVLERSAGPVDLPRRSSAGGGLLALLCSARGSPSVREMGAEELDFRMNHNFGELLGTALVGSARPPSTRFLRWARERGIGALVNATVSAPNAAARAVEAKERQLFHGAFLRLQIPNEHAPSDEQALRFLRFALAAWRKGQGLLIHCEGGVGRTATLSATLLMATLGLTADQAIEWVADNRNGSSSMPGPTIETEVQAEALRRIERSVIPRLSGEERAELAQAALQIITASGRAPASVRVAAAMLEAMPELGAAESAGLLRTVLTELNADPADPKALASLFWRLRAAAGGDTRAVAAGLTSLEEELCAATRRLTPEQALVALLRALAGAEAPEADRWQVVVLLAEDLRSRQALQPGAELLHRALAALQLAHCPLDQRLAVVRAALPALGSTDPGQLASAARAMVEAAADRQGMLRAIAGAPSPQALNPVGAHAAGTVGGAS